MAVQPEVQRALRDAAARLEQAGWRVEEVSCPPLREAASLQAVLWLTEYRRSGATVIAEEGDPDASFVYTQMSELCPSYDVAAVLDALQKRAALTRRWQLFLAEYPILLCPVSGELPFPDQLDVESPEAFRRVMEAQLTQVRLPLMGLPALTVSTGLAGRAPVGVQLVAGRYNEAILLDAATEIERLGVPPAPIDPVPAD